MEKNKCKKNSKTTKSKKTKIVFVDKSYKQKYFEFYDDVKDYTKGKEDW